MEKTLTIDGKQVRFKSTGATPLRYKAQFGKDYFSELLKMNKLRGFNTDTEDVNIEGMEIKELRKYARKLKIDFPFNIDIEELQEIVEVKVEEDEPDYEALQNLDLEVFYNICWSLAKTADKSIPEPIEWLEQFEEFPLFDVLPELQHLFAESLKGKKK